MYCINSNDSLFLAPVGAIESRCIFNEVSGAAISTALLTIQSAADHPSWFGGMGHGSWVFDRATICHRCKRIAAAINQVVAAIHCQESGGSWISLLVLPAVDLSPNRYY